MNPLDVARENERLGSEHAEVKKEWKLVRVGQWKSTPGRFSRVKSTVRLEKGNTIY